VTCLRKEAVLFSLIISLSCRYRDPLSNSVCVIYCSDKSELHLYIACLTRMKFVNGSLVSASITNCLQSPKETNFMELDSAREAANCAATQELLNILWKSKVHYCIHEGLPLVPIPNQTNLVHTNSSGPCKIHLNTSHLRLGLHSGHFPYSFPTNNLHAIL
jgi:hypothetical protein